MDKNIYSQTNELNLTSTTTTFTNLHQDKKESPTCTDTDIFLNNQPIIDPDCESSTLENDNLVNNKQIPLKEDNINNELLEEEDNSQEHSLQMPMEKNANITIVDDSKIISNNVNNSNKIIDSHNNHNNNIKNEDHIPLNESDTLDSFSKQNNNNIIKNNNKENENNCVTSCDNITTNASAITTNSLQSDQIIETIINNDTVTFNDNNNDNLNIEIDIPSSSTSLEGLEKGKNLNNDELEKNEHVNLVYNTNSNNSDENNDEDNRIGLLNNNYNSSDDTAAATYTLISNEQTIITNNEDQENNNISSDTLQSAPSSSRSTENENTLNITNQSQNNNNNHKNVDDEEEEKGNQIVKEEVKKDVVTIATTSNTIDQLQSSSKFIINDNENNDNENNDNENNDNENNDNENNDNENNDNENNDNENNDKNNNNNNLINIPPISNSVTTRVITTVDNLHNTDTQTSEQSGNVPEQNTSIINAQQQDNYEAQVTQIDESDRNDYYQQLNPPSQPLLSTSSPPSSELTTTMATATSNSLSIFTTTDNNNNINSNNNNNYINVNHNNINNNHFSSNENELRHFITDQSPSPSLNRTNTYASDEQTLIEPRTRRIWESDRQTSECRKCNRKFNFLVRRHHCRRCGQIFCDRCSSHRIKLPVEEIVEDPLIATSHYPIIALSPQRVCDSCSRIPIKADSNPSRYLSSSSSASPYGKVVNQLRPTPVNMKRSDSQQSLMAECPVCGTGLLGMRKSQQESHLNDCLNTGSPTIRPPRYIVYTITEGAAQLGDECPICFEEFQVGNKIARMVCLCSYHKNCLRDWLERGKGCPIHYDSYIQTT